MRHVLLLEEGPEELIVEIEKLKASLPELDAAVERARLHLDGNQNADFCLSYTDVMSKTYCAWWDRAERERRRAAMRPEWVMQWKERRSRGYTWEQMLAWINAIEAADAAENTLGYLEDLYRRRVSGVTGSRMPS